MKVIRVISSPGTKLKIIEEKTVYAPVDNVYFLQDGDLTFSKTQQQSEEYIKQLEEYLNEANKKLEALLDILQPNRHDIDDCED